MNADTLGHGEFPRCCTEPARSRRGIPIRDGKTPYAHKRPVGFSARPPPLGELLPFLPANRADPSRSPPVTAAMEMNGFEKVSQCERI
jgi:hypothetical protein